MNYQLLVHLNIEQAPFIHNLTAAIYLIGKHFSCDILVLDRYVSRQHCTLILLPPDKNNLTPYYSIVDGVLMATHSKSTNGTWINGKKITNLTQLNHQDTITFGPYEYPKAVFTADNSEIKDDGTFSEYI